MKPTDLKTLSARLAEMAEYYDKRPPGAAAMKVWNDALAECLLDDVQAVLTDWPKSHRQMPLADEVLKACRTRMSERAEQTAAAHRASQGGLRDMVAGLSANPSPNSAKVREQIREWARRQRDADPKAWAKALCRREQAGEELLDAQRKAWREALRWAGDEQPA